MRTKRLVVVAMGVVTLALLAAFALSRLADDTPDQGRRYPTPSLPQRDSEAPAAGMISPEAYGAVGDGVQDDGAAVQAALDDAGGRTVQLSPGKTYRSTVALTLPSHTTLVGDPTSVLAFTWEHSNDPGGGGPFYIGNEDQTDGNSDIVLSGFSIRGAGDGLPAGPMDESARNVPALRLRVVNTFELRGLDVSFAPGVSILYQGSVHGLITDNHVHDSGRDGITGTALGRELADITVSDNLIERVGDDAIAIAGATVRESNSTALPRDITIEDNRIAGWTQNPNGKALGRGIAMLAVSEVHVLRNTIERTAGAGILLRGAPSNASVNPLDDEPWFSSHITISGNTVHDAAALTSGSTLPDAYGGANGLDIDRAEYVVAQDNELDAAVGEPVAVKDCDHCDIQR